MYLLFINTDLIRDTFLRTRYDEIQSQRNFIWIKKQRSLNPTNICAFTVDSLFLEYGALTNH